MPETPTDLLRDRPDLLRAFRRGEPEAMTQVYLQYQPLVRTICRHGSGNFRGFFDPVEVDDAVQQIFLAAFEERARSSYDGLRAYSTFLRGVALNVVRRMLSSRARFQRQPEEFAPTGSPAPDQELARSEGPGLVERFRASLDDDRQRDILERYFARGESEEHIAKELGITRYRLRKTLALLNKRMSRFQREHGLG